MFKHLIKEGNDPNFVIGSVTDNYKVSSAIQLIKHYCLRKCAKLEYLLVTFIAKP